MRIWICALRRGCRGWREPSTSSPPPALPSLAPSSPYLPHTPGASPRSRCPPCPLPPSPTTHTAAPPRATVGHFLSPRTGILFQRPTSAPARRPPLATRFLLYICRVFRFSGCCRLPLDDFHLALERPESHTRDSVTQGSITQDHVTQDSVTQGTIRKIASLKVASLKIASLKVASLKIASLKVASLKIASLNNPPESHIIITQRLTARSPAASCPLPRAPAAAAAAPAGGYRQDVLSIIREVNTRR